MLKIFKGEEIRSVDSWFTNAPPKKGEKQWVDGRSAKELAKAWFPTDGLLAFPIELQDLLDSRDETRQVQFDRGEPERVIHFDNCGGEGRNADLVLWGASSGGRALASVEAKADESFDKIAGEYVRSASASNPCSRVPERFALLCQGVLGVGRDNEDACAIRYQLLTAVAGAVVDANRYDAELVMLIVHEFVGATNPDKLRTNAEDLDRLVRMLSSDRTMSVSPGELVGPFEIPGNEHFAGSSGLFVGKCRRNL